MGTPVDVMSWKLERVRAEAVEAMTKRPAHVGRRDLS